MCPFDTTRVIPVGWSQHHAPALVSTFNATCRVFTVGASVHDPVTDDTTPTGQVVSFEGPCRVQQLDPGATATTVAGDLPVGQTAYLVELPYDVTGVTTEHQVRILTAVNDPDLAGVLLQVARVVLGSERFTQSLICTRGG